MKTIGLMITGILVLVLMSAQLVTTDSPREKVATTGISFNENPTLASLMESAKNEDKIIFVDVYASWCGPCKLLKKNTFSDEKLGNYFNKHFVNAAFDGEIGEGINVAGKYGVRAYPTMLFLSTEGKVIKKVVGYHTPEELLEVAQNVVK